MRRCREKTLFPWFQAKTRMAMEPFSLPWQLGAEQSSSWGAPGAELIVVKLRRASPYYIKQFLRPEHDPNLYESTDYLLGLDYIVKTARRLNRPFVLCIGMGSNQGTHDGNWVLEEYISFISKLPGCAVVTAAGNESNAKHHTYDVIPRTGGTKVINVRVGTGKTSFTMTILGSPYKKSPLGLPHQREKSSIESRIA